MVRVTITINRRKHASDGNRIASIRRLAARAITAPSSSIESITATNPNRAVRFVSKTSCQFIQKSVSLLVNKTDHKKEQIATPRAA